MGLKAEIESDVQGILTQTWDLRDGKVIPQSNDVALAGGGVKMKVAILYSDLADSTELAMNFDRRIAARVSKAFMAVCARVVRAHGAEIRSYDGDRIMGIFAGDMKNTRAAKAALQINWAFRKVLKPRFEAKYSNLKARFSLAHATGVDTSDVLIVRGGIRKNNDLVWIGRAPNVAAKLSNLRDSPYHSWITAAVYNSMADSSKLSDDGRSMWEKRAWTKGPVRDVYRSKWTWTPS